MLLTDSKMSESKIHDFAMIERLKLILGMSKFVQVLVSLLLLSYFFSLVWWGYCFTLLKLGYSEDNFLSEYGFIGEQ